MIKELTKPGRDIREEMPKPVLRSDLLSLEDLKRRYGAFGRCSKRY